MTSYIVGVDCATKDNKVGVAKAVIENDKCRVIAARICSDKDKAADIIFGWHKETPISLLALDAPLGWPSSLGAALRNHKAGEHIAVESDKLFHRETDNKIKLPSGRNPLEVGADRIARTAKSALKLLHELRNATDKSIPLAWEMGVPQELSAIEVYPAATRCSLYLSVTPMPPKANELQKVEHRREIIKLIAQTIDVSSDVTAAAEKSDHVFDAILCVVAAAEFIAGRCQKPDDLQLAQKEGWIWVGP